MASSLLAAGSAVARVSTTTTATRRRHHNQHRASATLSNNHHVNKRAGGGRGATRVLRRAIQEPSSAESSEEPVAEVLPEARLDDSEIPAPVGTATKDEFMKWMLQAQSLPAQKLELVVDLPEGRGLVVRGWIPLSPRYILQWLKHGWFN
jgi:hypothetical protein